MLPPYFPAPLLDKVFTMGLVGVDQHIRTWLNSDRNLFLTCCKYIHTTLLGRFMFCQLIPFEVRFKASEMTQVCFTCVSCSPRPSIEHSMQFSERSQFPNTSYIVSIG